MNEKEQIQANVKYDSNSMKEHAEYRIKHIKSVQKALNDSKDIGNIVLIRETVNLLHILIGFYELILQGKLDYKE